MIDALITNGQVIDGSGSPRFFAAVAVSGDTVTIDRDGEVPYRLIAQTMFPSGREFYPLTRSEHLDVLAFRPYTSQPNIGNVLASCISRWNLLERSTLRPLSMSSVATCPASTIFAGWRQSVLPVHLLGLDALLGCVGAVDGDVKLQDDGVVHDPVNRGGGGHGVGEYALPLREDQV